MIGRDRLPEFRPGSGIADSVMSLAIPSLGQESVGENDGQIMGACESTQK